jgi:hypothetical protein
MRMKDRVTGLSPFLLIPLSLAPPRRASLPLQGGEDNVMTLPSRKARRATQRLIVDRNCPEIKR